MPKVLIFKETLLPVSETFILAQMGALTKFTPRLAGLERVNPSLPIPDESLVLCKTPSRGASLRAKVYRRTGVAPLFHRAAKQFRPDLLHAHFASGGRSLLPMARILGVPLVTTFHGADVTVKSGTPEMYSALRKEAALFLCVSEFIRDSAIRSGFPAEKLKVHYIGVDVDQFSPTEADVASQRVLFVGRLVEKKGCEYLLHAMAEVRKTHPSASLTVIGDGPLRGRLEQIAGELKLNATFLGNQTGTEVREALRKTRVFCVPSITAENGDSEGLGIVFAEAQAMGVPVVSTRHGGIPEIVRDGVTGILAPERDSAALAAGLVALLGQPAQWEAFHSACIQHVRENFNLQKQTAVLEEIYSELLEQKRSRGR